jgi:hypothetical protein
MLVDNYTDDLSAAVRYALETTVPPQNALSIQM